MFYTAVFFVRAEIRCISIPLCDELHLFIIDCRFTLLLYHSCALGCVVVWCL